MPEIPDLTIYLEAMEARLLGEKLLGVRSHNVFVLRTVTPSAEDLIGLKVGGIERIGKRLILALEQDFYIAIHLMIAGRLKWQDPNRKKTRIGLMAFDFSSGTLVLTEAGKKHRASVMFLQGKAALIDLNRGGIEIFNASFDEFCHALTHENHTLKRALTDQKFVAGIGNAYSDEILHHARLSPLMLTSRLTDKQCRDLWRSVKIVLETWTSRLRQESKGKFPGKVTAFHTEMAAHGKYKQSCPDCGHSIQRIRYASNECNYCAHCQNQDRILADRSLSRLLKKDWPKTLEQLEHQE